METYQQRVLLYVKLDPATLGPLPNCARDVREVGHYGTGDLELSIRTVEDFESAKRFIELAYQNVGG
jgi:predicted transport protein